MNESRKLEQIAFDQRQFKIMLQAIELYKEKKINLKDLYSRLCAGFYLKEIDLTYKQKIEALIEHLDYLNECLTELAYSDEQIKQDSQEVKKTITTLIQLINKQTDSYMQNYME